MYYTLDDDHTGVSVLFLWHGDVDVELIANLSDDFALLANDLRVVFFGNLNLK